MATQTDTDPDLGPLSRDGILNKAVHLWQPKRGYRFATDAIFLAAHVDAQPGQKVLDVGCGVGTVGLALAWRCGDIDLTGCDLDGGLLRLARRNAEENGISAGFHEADVLTDIPASLAGQFDHVVCNPPFHDQSKSRASPDRGRAQALSAPRQQLSDWLRFCNAAAHPEGQVHWILRADRLSELESSASRLFSGWAIRPLQSVEDKPPTRVLVSLKKSRFTGSKSLPPFILHEKNGEWARNALRILAGVGFSHLV